MPKTWFTADTHFGHGNIIKHCQRPFLSDAEENLALESASGNWKVSAETVRRHDQHLIDTINSLVQPNDTLWIIGDFCWGDLENAERYRQSIRCRDVGLVWGNHDSRSIASLFEKTIDQGMVKISGQNIWLNHYPMRSWNKSFHGSWHLYGHVHGRLMREDSEQPWMLVRDVGVDACGFRPVEFDEVVEFMSPRQLEFEKWKSNLNAT